MLWAILFVSAFLVGNGHFANNLNEAEADSNTLTTDETDHENIEWTSSPTFAKAGGAFENRETLTNTTDDDGLINYGTSAHIMFEKGIFNTRDSSTVTFPTATSPISSSNDSLEGTFSSDSRVGTTVPSSESTKNKSSTVIDTSIVTEPYPGHFIINVSACLEGRVYEIVSNQAKVQAMTGVETFEGSLKCEWVVSLHSEDRATITVGEEKSGNGTCGAMLSVCAGEFPCQSVEVCGDGWTSPVIRSNQIRFRYSLMDTSKMTSLTMQITAVSGGSDQSHELDVVHTSPSAGYVTSPSFGVLEKYPSYVDTSFTLAKPENHVLMLSFPHFHLEHEYDGFCMFDTLTLYTVDDKDEETEVWVKCGAKHIPADVFNTSVRLHFFSEVAVEESGFKMLFSVLHESRKPQALAEGIFNCSVPYFSDFRKHLDCNLETECIGKEDEMHCPYKNEFCGPDLIYAEGRCYTYLAHPDNVNWYDALAMCKDLGQTLVSLNTHEEWNVFTDVMGFGKLTTAVYVGLRTSQVPMAAVPSMYREVWQWADNTMAYYINMTEEILSVPSCSLYLPEERGVLKAVSCLALDASHVVCEPSRKNLDSSENTASLSLAVKTSETITNISWTTNLTVIPCPEGHATYDFLSCDPGTNCRNDEFLTSCMTQEDVITPMFDCDRTMQTLHYTFVCDHRADCSDRSDEEFCKHEDCPADQCTNEQCISKTQRCDGMQDCADGSDENCHPAVSKTVPSVLPPAVVHLDGYGDYILANMSTYVIGSMPQGIGTHQETENASQDIERCPVTHFQCPGSYCLPVYVRCNGVYDCPGGEDEGACDSYMCPGFYRCRDSSVCVHNTHVCDGVFQCPQQDDELLCDLKCPEGCHCQGLAFVCTAPFPAVSYPSLRYLNGSGSGMTPAHFSHNVYLIRLILSSCMLRSLTSMALPNLRTLDLSNNLLISVYMDVFMNLKNLRSLDLSSNPLSIVHKSRIENTLPRLYHLDLSQTHMTFLDKDMFVNTPYLKVLNFSHGDLSAILPDGFKSIPVLEILDLRGTPIKDFPPDTLHILSVLKTVYADSFKFCCQASLPKHFNPKDCYAVADAIASCEDLLRSDVYRACLWVFAALAFLGNAGSFVARLRLQRKSGGGFHIFVTNLSVADFLMGVYLIVIGVADQVYRGEYLWHDTEWKTSTSCQVAGFLSLLSSEVSAFTICLITVDRFLALRFPLHDLALGRRSAILSCVLAWAVGVVLAGVPLLPATSHWEFYSQTGICSPLPVTPDEFKGHDYSFGVMVVFNFALFLMIAMGQLFIYLSVRSNSLLTVNKESVDIAVARRLTTIVLSDFLCWFPVGVLGILASTGTPIPGEVNVGMAIFVLPFNSALNPFLYTFNVVMEKRRRAAEQRLLKRLECRTEVSVAATPYPRKTVPSDFRDQPGP